MTNLWFYFLQLRLEGIQRSLGLRLLVLILVAASCLSVASARPTRTATTVQPRTGTITYLNMRTGVHYVGSEVCARCHADIYDEYIQTAMGRSMTLPGDAAQVNLLATPVIVQSRKLHRDYEEFRRAGDLYQSEFELDANGNEIFRDTQRIAYVIGAGQNGIGYIVQKENYLFEAPVTYYARSHLWGLSPGYEFADYGFLRPVPEACLVCHSGRARPVSGRPGLYKNPPFEQLAIGCENCHGPGQLHVAERLKGAPLRGTVDRSIVNPAHLPSWLADNVCMMCHQAGDTRILQPGRSYGDFRPGTPLDKTVAIFAVPFTPASPPHSPLLQHYELMILSRCYRSSSEKMSCITCHDPHLQPSAAQAPAYYRKKCLICHTEHSCTLALAKRLQKSLPDNCIGCHMPQQNLQRIAHSALTNHRIIAYLGEPFPRAAFQQTTVALPDLVHLDAIHGTDTAPSSMVLFGAYGELISKNPEYKAKYEKLLDHLSSAQPHNPTILSALARRKLARGTPGGLAAAKDDLGQAIGEGSTLHSDYEIDARLLARSGETAEAISILKRGIALNPYSPRLYKRLALLYIRTKDYGEALIVMKREIKIYPEDSFMRTLIQKAEGLVATP
ncbi:MAG: tetratricopeptide repeat protein [Terriglobia bacterium]